MSDFLTRVHLHYGRDKFNHYIRFGVPTYRDNQSPREAYEYYSTGAIFGYVRWETNNYGTLRWRFFILKGGDEKTFMCSIPGVSPGAEVLADISGKERVHRLFEAIDCIEANDIDPCEVASWYWVQSNARINSSLKPFAYSPEMHRTWLLEQELGV